MWALLGYMWGEKAHRLWRLFHLVSWILSCEGQKSCWYCFFYLGNFISNFYLVQSRLCQSHLAWEVFLHLSARVLYRRGLGDALLHIHPVTSLGKSIAQWTEKHTVVHWLQPYVAWRGKHGLRNTQLVYLLYKCHRAHLHKLGVYYSTHSNNLRWTRLPMRLLTEQNFVMEHKTVIDILGSF